MLNSLERQVDLRSLRALLGTNVLGASFFDLLLECSDLTKAIQK